MGGLGGNKSADNTDLRRETQRDNTGESRGGGHGEEVMMD